MITKPQVQKLRQLAYGLEVKKVVGPRILVKSVTPYTDMDRVEKEGLLVVPEVVKEKNIPLPNCGVVVKVGDGVFDIACGDMVLFNKFAGGDYSFDGETGFKILEVNEVLCILEDKEHVLYPTTD